MINGSRPSPSAGAGRGGVSTDAAWGRLIPDDQWEHFIAGTRALDAAGVPFVLAGAMALATYTGHWRNTKDVDVIIRDAGHERAVSALQGAGFDDYHDQLAYDRSWIFRGIKGGVLFDIIWALPNHRVEIDNDWFERAQSLRLRGRELLAAPAEEIIRVKLYVLQRERCDWVDVLNLIASAVNELDWRWLVQRMDRDLPLLHGVLAVFNWMSPARARTLPAWLRELFALPLIATEDPAAMEARHVRLFDSRPWFAPHLPVDQPLER